jgi:hypothetical protein
VSKSAVSKLEVRQSVEGGEGRMRGVSRRMSAVLKERKEVCEQR